MLLAGLAPYRGRRHTDCWGMLEQTPAGSEVHLVQGALSDRWSPDTVRRMKASRSCREFLGVAHRCSWEWVH